jgi:homoserine O-acetyltransferase
MQRLLRLVVIAALIWPLSAFAQDLIVEKKTFSLPSYTTVAGETIKNVKIGWESAGTLNADKSNAILVGHFFSGTSHAFGKYSKDDKSQAIGIT